MNEKFKEILNQVNPEILDSEGLDLVEEGIIDSLQVMQIVAGVEDFTSWPAQQQRPGHG